MFQSVFEKMALKNYIFESQYSVCLLYMCEGNYETLLVGCPIWASLLTERAGTVLGNLFESTHFQKSKNKSNLKIIFQRFRKLL